MEKVTRRTGVALLAPFSFGGIFFTLEVISTPSTFLHFVGLLTHGELLPLY